MRWLSVLRNAAELCVTCATPTIEHITTLESRETWGRVDHRCAPKRSHNQKRLVKVVLQSVPTSMTKSTGLDKEWSSQAVMARVDKLKVARITN
mmetsp:Transcript_28877/g.76190  ORF Transcript_28877/g.76190 Transcript_28877/m.76190 type:complete len:94 (-) Transcript_28877:93-374(-)